jgi:ribonuclease R
VPFPARFRPHPRGFGFLTPVGPDGHTPVEVELTDAAGATRAVDRVFVPPPLAKGLLADDLVDADAELDDKGATATARELRDRPRRMLVGRVQQGPGRLVVEPDPALGTGWVRLDDGVASKLQLAVGRQVVVLLGDAEDGAPVGRALVAGPHVVGSPQAVRANAVVVALGRAAPTLVPGGAAGAGLDPVEAATTHTRVVGLLAGGGRGAAAGRSTDGPRPGASLSLADSSSEPCITVDDANAKDLDDAVAASWDGEPTSPVHVAVHIADASGAIGIGSDADRYARTVASSAYLASGENAPMLDPVLSEDALSLLPDVDRQVLTVRFDVAADGTIGEVTVDAAWVRSRAKLSYAAVEAWLAGDPTAVQRLAGPEAPVVEPVLAAAVEASRRLGVERDARATFEDLFSSAELEPAVVDGKLTTVEAEPHAEAYRLIERLMVAANESVARWLVERDVPALYRAHAGLDADRAATLRAAAELVGIDLPALTDEGVDADAVVAQVLAAVDELARKGRDDDRDLLVTAATGATARASYDPDPAHHRGLASSAYTHFTSPIRRYADLVVHRQIRAALAGDPPPHSSDELRAMAPWLDARAGAIDHLQKRERADLWSRLLDRGFLDGPEPAVVTGLTPAGLRVRLPRLGIGGFVTAERALDLPPRERGRLEVDEHGLTTSSGPWRVGTHVVVRFAGLDDTGRANWRLGTVDGGR